MSGAISSRRRIARTRRGQRQVHIARRIGGRSRHDHGAVRICLQFTAGARRRHGDVERDFLLRRRFRRRAGRWNRVPSRTDRRRRHRPAAVAQRAEAARRGPAARLRWFPAARSPAVRPDWRVQAAGCESCCRHFSSPSAALPSRPSAALPARPHPHHRSTPHSRCCCLPRRRPRRRRRKRRTGCPSA